MTHRKIRPKHLGSRSRFVQSAPPPTTHVSSMTVQEVAIAKSTDGCADPPKRHAEPGKEHPTTMTEDAEARETLLGDGGARRESEASSIELADIPSVNPRRSVAKAISWRVVGTLDTLLLSFVILTFLAPFLGLKARSSSANAQTATHIAVTEVATKMALYVAHERLWARVRWDVGVDEAGARVDGVTRSGVKTMTWRVTASMDTCVLALIFTGNVATAVSIGGFEVATKLVLYYVHERAWARVRWGVGAKGSGVMLPDV